MIELLQKVLTEKKDQKKSRCRHSDDKHTIVAYDMFNRANDVGFIRVDIYRASDMRKHTTKESTRMDDK